MSLEDILKPTPFVPFYSSTIRIEWYIQQHMHYLDGLVIDYPCEEFLDKIMTRARINMYEAGCRREFADEGALLFSQRGNRSCLISTLIHEKLSNSLSTIGGRHVVVVVCLRQRDEFLLLLLLIGGSNLNLVYCLRRSLVYYSWLLLNLHCLLNARNALVR